MFYSAQMRIAGGPAWRERAVHFPVSSADQILSALPGTSYPAHPAHPADGGTAGSRLDDLLDETVALLMRAVSTLGLPEEGDGDDPTATPARSAGRIAADAARLTAAVAQLIRAHHLHTAPAPAPQAASTQAAAALVALLTELDAEADADADQERTRP